MVITLRLRCLRGSVTLALSRGSHAPPSTASSPSVHAARQSTRSSTASQPATMRRRRAAASSSAAGVHSLAASDAAPASAAAAAARSSSRGRARHTKAVPSAQPVPLRSEAGVSGQERAAASPGAPTRCAGRQEGPQSAVRARAVKAVRRYAQCRSPAGTAKTRELQRSGVGEGRRQVREGGGRGAMRPHRSSPPPASTAPHLQDAYHARRRS